MPGENEGNGVAYQGAGSDQTQNASGQGEGQQGSGQEQGKATVQAGELTEERVLEIATKAANEAAEDAKRYAQRRSDQLGEKFRKQMTPIDETLKKLNLPVDQEDELRGKIGEALEGTESSTSTEGQGQGQAGGAEQLDPVTALGYELQQKAGVFIQQGDPEFANVKADGTGGEYIESLQAAINAKKNRLATEGGGQGSGGDSGAEGSEDGEAGETGANAGRMTAFGSGGRHSNPIKERTDPGGLLAEGFAGKK